jgi:hypothetical protein
LNTCYQRRNRQNTKLIAYCATDLGYKALTNFLKKQQNWRGNTVGNTAEVFVFYHNDSRGLNVFYFEASRMQRVRLAGQLVPVCKNN